MAGKADPKLEAKWSGYINAWENSGQTRKAFCTEHGLNPNTLDYWRTRLNKKALLLESPVFVSLPVATPVEPAWQRAELRFHNGACLSWQFKDFIELGQQLRTLALL